MFLCGFCIQSPPNIFWLPMNHAFDILVQVNNAEVYNFTQSKGQPVKQYQVLIQGPPSENT